MKKLTKKLLAVMLSVMMVCTVLPFSSLTALADGQSELEAAIGRYDAMCSALAGDNGYANLKTNLVPAYEAYINALRVLNNVDENGNTVYSTDAQMSAAATALNSELGNCANFVEYTANTVPVMGGTNADAGYYNKVIYASNDTLTQTTSQANAKAGYLNRDGAGTMRYYIYYPDAVLLDDGKDTKTVNDVEVNDRPVLPVILGLYKYSSTSYVQFVTETTEHFDLINDYWKGDSNTKSQTTVANNNNVQANNTLFWNPYNDNLLRSEADSVTTDEEIYNPIAFFCLKNAMRYYRPSNSNDTLVTVDSTTWMTQQRYGTSTVSGGLLTDSGTKVYIINYKKLIDALKSNLKKYSDTGYFSREYIEQALLEGDGSITPILEPLFVALDKATSFSPSASKYTYSTNIATAATNCANDIDSIIDELNTAKPDNVLAAIKNLERVIGVYEAKMNNIQKTGQVLSNMKAAYDAYQIAKQYDNAYNYGLEALKSVLMEANGITNENDFEGVTHYVDLIAKDLDKKTDAMQPMVYGNYNVYADEAFQFDTISSKKSKWYINSYRNLVWAGKAPVREVSGTSYNDSTAPGLLRMNQEYNTTNLYVPRAVAVYDNDSQRFTATGASSTSGAYIASVPIMMGYMNENGNGRNLHSYIILSSSASIDEVQLEGKWKIGTDSTGAQRSQHLLSLSSISDNSDDFGMVDRLNSEYTTNFNGILRSNGSTNGGFWGRLTTSTYYSSDMYNYFSEDLPLCADAVNSYYYYANRLYINLPTWSNTGVEQFYYEVDDFWGGQSGESGDSPSSTQTAGVMGHYGSTQSGTWGLFTGDRVTSVVHPSICIINYKPVRERIENGKAVLTAEGFDISDYSEGGLETYLTNMTQLTDVDPYNYNYTNDYTATYNSSGTMTAFGSFNSQVAAYQCATDIYNLLDAEDGANPVSIPDSTDPATILSATGATEDILTINELPDGATEDSNYYYELMNELGNIEEIRAQYDLTCLDDTEGIYDEYDAAVASAQTAMAQVAVNGYSKTQAEITALIDAIETAASDLQSETTTAPRNQHAARYKERVSDDRTNVTDYETAVFECTRNTTQHHVSTADMSVYDPLQIAVDSIDYDHYNNDNIIKNAEAVYDRMTDSVVARRTVGADGVQPQTMVDNAIAAMLTAINTANTSDDNYKYTSKYSVTFKTQVGDNGTATQVSSEANVLYGNTRTLTVPAETGTVYKWVVESSSGKRVRLVDANVATDTNPNSYELMVQDDVTITAYVMPTAETGKVIVKAQNPYGKVGYAYLLDADATIASAETQTTVNGKTTYSASQVAVDGVTFKPSDAAITLSSYTNNSFSLGASVNTKKLSEVANNGVWTLSLNATKNAAEKCTITYNGTATQYSTETELITINSTAENFVAIAVKNGDKYVPVSYGTTMQFYSNSDLELVDITTTDRINYYANGTLISGDAYFYYALKDANKLLPFVNSKMERLSTSNGKSTYGVYSLYSNTNNINNGAVEIVEYGTVFSRSSENLVIGTNGVIKSTAPNHSNCQFSNSITLAGDFYARGYVKYNYTFVNEDTNAESEIEAIVYSDVCSSADLT